MRVVKTFAALCVYFACSAMQLVQRYHEIAPPPGKEERRNRAKAKLLVPALPALFPALNYYWR